jgi:hypothetical protein
MAKPVPFVWEAVPFVQCRALRSDLFTQEIPNHFLYGYERARSTLRRAKRLLH